MITFSEEFRLLLRSDPRAALGYYPVLSKTHLNLFTASHPI